MAAIITEKFRIHNARQFKEDFADATSSTYLFIGRPYVWDSTDTIPTPANSVKEEIAAFNDMLAMKKVASGDVSHSIPRRNWTTGTTYEEYAHDYSASNLSPVTSSNNLYDTTFYVMSSAYNVYKCIRTGRNSSYVRQPSTVEPTGTAIAPITTADGYIWKYMYSVSASETIKFVTNDFIPCKTLGALQKVHGDLAAIGAVGSTDGSTQFASEDGADTYEGAIYHVRADNIGSGYTSGTYTNVPVEGDGTSAVATVVISSGGVESITMTANGTNYTSGTMRVAAIGAGNGNNDMVLTPIISPLLGHGADPVNELGANYVIVNSRLEFAEGGGDFPTTNDFRRIGLLQDPQKVVSAIAADATLATYKKFTLSSVSGVVVDSILLNADADGDNIAVARVVSIVGSVVSYLPIPNSFGGYADFSVSDNMFISGSASSFGTVSSLDSTFPEALPRTGKIIYVENRGAVSRAADQIEDIKLIVQM